MVVLPDKGEKELCLPKSIFADVLVTALHAVEVDESWYLAHYTDVRHSVERGAIQSAKHHYVDHGYFEGRLPRHIDVDEIFYLTENPDVAEAVKNGIFRDAKHHFFTSGHDEGRLPSKNFSLFLRAKSDLGF